MHLSQVDLRVDGYDVTVTKGLETHGSISLTSDGVPDLVESLAIWVGGPDTPSEEQGDAIAYTATSTGATPSAEWELTIPPQTASRQTLRWVINGRVVGVGALRTSTRGRTGGDHW